MRVECEKERGTQAGCTHSFNNCCLPLQEVVAPQGVVIPATGRVGDKFKAGDAAHRLGLPVRGRLEHNPAKPHHRQHGAADGERSGNLLAEEPAATRAEVDEHPQRRLQRDAAGHHGGCC